MLTARQKRAIRENVNSDRIVFKKDGTVSIRHGYFYRGGRTAEKHGTADLGRMLSLVVTHQDLAGVVPVLVSAEDHWNPWPRDSFFESTFSFTGA